MITNESETNVIDAGAITLWLASAVNILPSIAAILSIIWFVIRILETETVQGRLGRFRWIKEGSSAASKDLK